MNYVRNAWYAAAWTHEVCAQRPAGVRVLDQPVVLWRGTAGDLRAFEDRCIHRLAPLSLGRCEGERMRCMYHGLLYDREGRVVEIPGQDRVPGHLRLRAYPVEERYGLVWIWMGPAAADPGLIPPVIGMEHPGFCGHGQLDYAAEARFVNDNLLDLSHVGFLHPESSGSSENWAREPLKVTEHERGVRIERWVRNEVSKLASGANDWVDVYSRTDFFIPGVFVVTNVPYPSGTANALNGQPPDISHAAQAVGVQAITPLTQKSARSFYMIIVDRQANEAVRDTAMATVARVFAEDKKMIEAQQRTIDDTPDWCFKPMAFDQGVVAYNRLVKKMLAEETA